ncbi:hypothetical protein PVAND_017166 [Polypedilum vanderplanki]|uniref:MD-2-related lipid-recognition domain-containing protein n=1 Tax=Polypedilum vanderplanki TaxID=319348 RepID=A0A9J6BHG5_POLVA|nr:hypothetical protein PVAND_017166 [Polypedilum vanderplanki]
MLKVIFLTVLLAACSVNAQQSFWSICTDLPNALAPRQIISPACPPGADRCTATRGEALEADVYFTPVRAHNYMHVTVTAFILGIGIDLAPDDDNACNDLFRNGVQVSCPTVPNVEHVWSIRIFVSRLYPAFNNARVRFLLSENNVPEGCADVRATLI